jgi:branched-chain amino acid transport system substrate-binding protein
MSALRSMALAGLLAACPVLAWAQASKDLGNQEPIRIGFISSFTGPVASSTRDMSDGFKLALKMMNNRIAGRPVIVSTGDAEGKPQIGRQLADQFLTQDHVQIVTGVNLSSVLLGLVRPVLDAGAFYISDNAGPSQLAGKGCQPHFFSFSHQNDTLYVGVGYLANEDKLPSVYLVGSNYPAGHDMLNGFKQRYTGKVVGETYTPLDQLDYAGIIADIRAKNPAGVMIFLPGNDGVNFIKQFAASGLKQKMALLSGSGVVDMVSVPAIGEAALGMQGAVNWNHDIDIPASKTFVAAFETEYNRTPSSFAAVAYDTMRAIDAAATSIGGKIEDKAAFQHALETVKWDSVRGTVTMNTNHFPKQDMWKVVVVKDGKGQIVTKSEGRVAEQIPDIYAQDCKMPQG